MSAKQETHRRRSLLSFAAAALLALAATAQVATIDDSGNYRRELQSCMNGQTAQDRESCIREARSAQAERQRGMLTEAQQQYQANALARCAVFEASDEKSACRARVMGEGQASGSVASGGILRQYEYTVPADVVPASNAGASATGAGFAGPPPSVAPSARPPPSPVAGPTAAMPPGAARGATSTLGAPALQPGPASGLAPLPAATR